MSQAKSIFDSCFSTPSQTGWNGKTADRGRGGCAPPSLAEGLPGFRGPLAGGLKDGGGGGLAPSQGFGGCAPEIKKLGASCPPLRPAHEWESEARLSRSKRGWEKGKKAGPPIPPGMGAPPPAPPDFFPPSFAWGPPGFRVPLVGKLQERATRPFGWFLWGDTPQTPREGALPPPPPFWGGHPP